jgi:hypothetical protein
MVLRGSTYPAVCIGDCCLERSAAASGLHCQLDAPIFGASADVIALPATPKQAGVVIGVLSQSGGERHVDTVLVPVSSPESRRRDWTRFARETIVFRVGGE